MRSSDLEASAPLEADGGTPARRRIWPLRPETAILLVAAIWTLGAKLIALREHEPEHLFTAWLDITLPDLVFLSAVGVALPLLYLIRWTSVVARLTLLLSAAVLVWAICNAAWLIATGVQIQPGVLWVLLADPWEFAPVVSAHLQKKPLYAGAAMLTLVAAIVWFVWRFVRPVPAARSARAHLRRAATAAVVLGASVSGLFVARPWVDLGYGQEVLGFSSHWLALVRTVADANGTSSVTAPRRLLPHDGERVLRPPGATTDDLPNVVIVFLEGVSRAATSLGDADEGATPTLVRLAGEGTEFTATRVPMAATSKAFWAVLTGSTPDIRGDCAESVLADRPYDALATILGRVGYRSAFFEVSKGSFECAPGMFTNLGFDWGWFRENLEDPTAHVGHFGGDDFRILGPAFEWVDEGPEPFLLATITSIAHDPYEVPAWFDRPADDPQARYAQAVRYTDAFVDELCAHLEERGLLDDTILCVLGDHGDSFRPTTRHSRWTPFEEVITVPWVLRWPGHVESGRRVEAPTSQMDVTPTILTLLGFDASEAGFHGIDALGAVDPQRRVYFASWYPRSPRGFVEGTRKLVYWPYTDSLFEFDLEDDPSETSPRRLQGPEKDAVVAEIEAWREASHFVIPAKRFRERFLYDHWRTFSSGRSAWAYYVSKPEPADDR